MSARIYRFPSVGRFAPTPEEVDESRRVISAVKVCMLVGAVLWGLLGLCAWALMKAVGG